MDQTHEVKFNFSILENIYSSYFLKPFLT